MSVILPLAESEGIELSSFGQAKSWPPSSFAFNCMIAETDGRF
jgi:hypothetical protein